MPFLPITLISMSLDSPAPTPFLAWHMYRPSISRFALKMERETLLELEGPKPLVPGDCSLRTWEPWPTGCHFPFAGIETIKLTFWNLFWKIDTLEKFHILESIDYPDFDLLTILFLPSHSGWRVALCAAMHFSGPSQRNSSIRGLHQPVRGN